LLEERHPEPEVRDAERVEATVEVDAEEPALGKGAQDAVRSRLAVSEQPCALGEREASRPTLADPNQSAESPVERLRASGKLSRQGLARVEVEEHDQVRHDCERLVTPADEEVLVLELDRERLAATVEALDRDPAAGKASDEAAVDVDDLASEQATAARQPQDG